MAGRPGRRGSSSCDVGRIRLWLCRQHTLVGGYRNGSFAAFWKLERRFEGQVERVKEATRESVAAVNERVEEVERQTGETLARLEDLARITRQVRDRRSEEKADLIRQFRHEVTAETTRSLIDFAIRLGAIEDFGLRLPLGRGFRLVLAPRTDEQGLELDEGVTAFLRSTEDARYGWVDWDPGIGIEQVVDELADLLAQIGEGGREEQIPAAIGRFVEVIDRAVEARMGQSSDMRHDLHPLLELVNEQWAVTSFGLEAIDTPYSLTWVHLDEDRIQIHVREKTWVDPELLNEAYDIAIMMKSHMDEQRRQQERRLSQEPPF